MGYAEWGHRMNAIAESRTRRPRYLTEAEVIGSSWEDYFDGTATVWSDLVGAPKTIYWSTSVPAYQAEFDLPFLQARHNWIQRSNVYLLGSNIYGRPITRTEQAKVTVYADYFRDVEWFAPALTDLQIVMNVDPADRESTDPSYAAQALTFFASALPPTTAPPSLSPLNDGGVQAEWHRGGLDVEIVFSPDESESGIFVRDKETGEEQELALDPAAFRALIGDRLRNQQ